MKLILLIAAISCSYAAKLERTYLPPTHAQTSGGSGFLQTPFEAQYQINGNGVSQTGNAFPAIGNNYAQNDDNGFTSVNAYDNLGTAGSRPERPRAALERNAAVLRQDNSNDGETYAFAYETENGIYAEENGVATDGVEAQGGFSYTGDDGQVYSVRYTADQNGFVPQGDHLPTSPPVPEEILKALEQNARDEAAGIYDDGSYNEAKYGDETNKLANNAQFVNYGNQYNGNDDAVVTTSAVSQPHAGTRDSDSAFSIQAFGQGASGVQKAYLPPFASQEGSDSGRIGSRNQPSFNARDGYRY